MRKGSRSSQYTTRKLKSGKGGEEGKGGTYPLGVLKLGFLSCAGHQLGAAVLAGGLRGHCFVAPCSVGVCMGVGGWCAYVYIGHVSVCTCIHTLECSYIS